MKGSNNDPKFINYKSAILTSILTGESDIPQVMTAIQGRTLVHGQTLNNIYKDYFRGLQKEINDDIDGLLKTKGLTTDQAEKLSALRVEELSALKAEELIALTPDEVLQFNTEIGDDLQALVPSLKNAAKEGNPHAQKALAAIGKTQEPWTERVVVTGASQDKSVEVF